MIGLNDAIQEILERIQGIFTIPDNPIEIEKELTVMRKLAREALALLESEHSEQEYDPWDYLRRCDNASDSNVCCQLPKGHTCDHVWFGNARNVSGRSGSIRWPILATPAESGEDDE